MTIANASGAGMLLFNQLGATSAGYSQFWTDPDGTIGGTLDHIAILGDGRVSLEQTSVNIPFHTVGSLLVSDIGGGPTVPEPNSAMLLALAAGFGGVLYRRKRKAQLQPALKPSNA